MLKYTKVNKVDLVDWNDLVEETYKRPYNLQQQDGCMGRGNLHISVPSKYTVYDYENDEIPEVINGEEMGVSFKAWLERDPEQDSLNGRVRHIFWERNFYPTLEILAEDLYNKGLIEAGNYIIDIDW